MLHTLLMETTDIKKRKIRSRIIERFGSQEALAREIRIDATQFSRMLNGWRKPTLEQREEIASKLDMEADEILGNDNIYNGE